MQGRGNRNDYAGMPQPAAGARIALFMSDASAPNIGEPRMLLKYAIPALTVPVLLGTTFPRSIALPAVFGQTSGTWGISEPMTLLVLGVAMLVIAHGARRSNSANDSL